MTTRSARARLPPGMHWRSIDPTVHLGYRKGTRGGRWLVRWYQGKGSYNQETIGSADDALDADGQTSLSFAQAASKARRIVEGRRAQAILLARGPMPTVRLAIEDYLAVRQQREDATASKKHDARSRLKKHVLNDHSFSETQLSSLTEEILTDWLERRTQIAASTIQRLCNDLRAALNLASRRYRTSLPADIGSVVRAGLATRRERRTPNRHRNQVLPDSEITRIIRAAIEVDEEDGWLGDLARMVVLLAATGARFSQLRRLRVEHVQVAVSRLTIPVSLKGDAAKNRELTIVPVGLDVLSTLKPVLAKRAPDEPLLLRPRWRQIGKSLWAVTGREVWKSASELKRPWIKLVKRAEISPDIIPYALRHSSIVRAIRAGLPLRLVAALHDTSTSMIERHYSAYIASALDEIAARAVVPLLPSAS